MRLWTLHPRYLDASGLVALWREALLAQAVLGGQTRGYTRHPQLRRFRDSPAPLAAIACYLQVIHDEATVRGYHFDAAKIGAHERVEPLLATQGQLTYEWAHLKAKLQRRAPQWLEKWGRVTSPEAHPLFRLVTGAVAEWEVAPSTAAR